MLPGGAPLRVSADGRQKVFQRSFTTNGVGRGLGPDSMQLLSGYLGGEVGFSTSEGEGKRFVGKYPRGLGGEEVGVLDF